MTTTMKLLVVSTALVMAGCGSVWVENVRIERRAAVAGTVEIEGEATVSGGEAGLVIVEQAPGQGFIVEPSATAALMGHGRSDVLVAHEVTASARAEGAITTAAWCEGECGGAAVESVGAGIGGSATTGAAHVTSGQRTSAESASMTAGATHGPSAASTGGGSASSDASTRGASTRSAAGASVRADAGFELEARAAVPRDGVWALDGASTALTAITGPGVQVDGVRVALDELEALAELSLPAAPSAALATDAAIAAWAELEHASLPRSGGETHVVVRVKANPAPSLPRGRLRVHLVIDRSSSMQRSWPRVLAAARMLIQRLDADDELQIVAYGGDAVEAFAVSRVGDGRGAIAALERVSVGGGTNIEAGLAEAYAAVDGGGDARSLVLLLSDGVPTRGAFEPAELGALAATARMRGATTSVIGLGTEFDARLLRAVAQKGHGGYHVSASLDALASGLVAELDAHTRSAARGLRVDVALGEGVELLGVSEGDAQRVEGGVVLATPHLDAGQERQIVLRVRVPAGARAREVAQVSLRYRSGLGGRAVQASRALEVSLGGRAVRSADGLAGAGVLDASLGAALDAAGHAIAEGDAAAAERALEAHAAFIEGRVEHRRSESVRARARITRRLGEAVHALLPSAGHAQRRQVAHAFGALAVRFAR